MIFLRLLCVLLVVTLHVQMMASPMAAQASLKSTAFSGARSTVAFSISSSSASSSEPAEASVSSPRAVEKAVNTSAQQMESVEMISADELSRKIRNAEPADDISQTTEASSFPNQTQAGVHEFVEISEPQFLSPPSPPRYPTLARKRGQEGTVWVDIVLDATGDQVQINVLRSSGVEMLDSAALLAVSNWRFKPYEADGVSRPSRVRIPVEFSLN